MSKFLGTVNKALAGCVSRQGLPSPGCKPTNKSTVLEQRDSGSGGEAGNKCGGRTAPTVGITHRGGVTRGPYPYQMIKENVGLLAHSSTPGRDQ